MLGAEAAVGVGERALEEGDDLGVGELLQRVDAAAGEQRRIDFERGILGGGADEADGSALDPWQEGILLGAVEAVNLIDEEDGAGAPGGGFFRVGHDLLDFFYAGEDGGEFDEGGFGGFGDDFGEGGFADAGRAPEDHRRGVVAIDLDAERFAGAEEMLLAEELVERVGAHALGERGGDGSSLVGGRGEEAHRWTPSSSLRRWLAGWENPGV